MSSSCLCGMSVRTASLWVVAHHFLWQVDAKAGHGSQASVPQSELGALDDAQVAATGTRAQRAPLSGVS